MRYAGIIDQDIENGPGFGVSLFVQGCPHRCAGCFDPETWSFDGGQPLTKNILHDLDEMIKQPYITRFSLLGGEPLADRDNSLEEIAIILSHVKQVRPDIQIWCWTGYTYNQLKGLIHTNYKLGWVLMNIDYLVDGPFVQEEKDLTLMYRGSRNQRILKRISFTNFIDITAEIDM